MNELKSYTEYAVSTPTADFVIGFDFNYGEDAVNVTVDDVPATTAGYTVVYLNETTIRLSPSVPSGVVRLQRETDIDQTDNTYRAGAKFIAQTMDENFKQIRHSQQEVNDNLSSLEGRTSARLDTFLDQVDNLNNEFVSTRDVVSDLVTISADTVTTANTALNTANAIDAKASTALSNSSTALSTATGVDAKATDALDNSLTARLASSAALNTANAVDGKATQALTDSTTALSSATTAVHIALDIDDKATQARSDAAAALTAASGTLKSSNNLSDVSSATISRANLGVMSSSEVTTAIANATPTIPNATETVAGKAKIATTEIAQAGTNDTDFLTAKKLRAALNATDNAPVYACRAWVSFDSTTPTLTIRASGNVSSVIHNGAGDYTINFAKPMPTSFYAVSSMATDVIAGTAGSAKILTTGSGSSSPLLKTVKAVRVGVGANKSGFNSKEFTIGVFC